MKPADKVKILLVDDQPSKLLSYEVILQDLNENLLKASSATDALECLLKNDVAVILADVCMPDLDGFELAAMIREHPRCEKTAIIFISAIHLTDMDRIKGYEMGAVDYVPVPVVPEVLRAKVRIFTELYRKTRQLEELNQELEFRVTERTAELETYATRLLQSERRRSLALVAGKLGSWDWDFERGDCMWDEGQCRIFGVNPDDFRVTPERVKALLDPEDWERLKEAWTEVTAKLDSYQTEFRVRRPNGEIRWCVGTAAATVDAAGRIIRLSGVTTDITDRKLAAERQAFLAREVDHRARNVLAVVQSILRLTKADTVEAYERTVEGRISALSRAHMLLAESRWQGADLWKLLDEELEPYRTNGASVITAVGPEALLGPQHAQTIALAVHELATNAAKYGALSLPSGKVRLGWAFDSDDLSIEWLEAGGPRISAPTTQGYGMRVIQVSLGQLGGRAEFDWQPGGLRCVLSLPHSKELKPSTAARGTPPSEQRARALSQIGRGNAVLIVEDEAIVAMMMEDALTKLGFRVVGPYSTVAEVLAAKVENQVDAAILDVNLGGAPVYPLADVLRENGIPFVFITGYGIESVDTRFAEVPLLQKPIDEKALKELFACPEQQARLASIEGADPLGGVLFKTGT